MPDEYFQSPRFVTIGDLEEKQIFFDTKKFRDRCHGDVPKCDVIIKGRVTRSRKGCDHTYIYESEDGYMTLKAKKHFMKYKIYRNDYCIAELHSNIFGSHYRFYLHECENLIINYKFGLCRSKGPREFEIIYLAKKFNGHLIEYWKEDYSNRFKVLTNRKPLYSAETNSFVLNFNGRVTMPSVKNFQIVHPMELSSVTLTFGKIDKDSFVLDYGHPWSPIRAFGIALTALDFKVGCE
ncbi:Tubby protein [Spraguea lophii 42_110]|uniref:Tubby protein n=1 Tax=Spraguea lophii (strain 42_110) TaxID=1358809 RepID=S7WAY6_SPRLO|nr:Tubby protein [Spraguea lophii 42_110]